MQQSMNEALRPILLKTRERLGLTQCQMAKRYVMANNTYSELEAGKHGFGPLTILLLLQDQEEPENVLKQLGTVLEQVYKEVSIIV